jgi:hypothetical protein
MVGLLSVLSAGPASALSRGAPGIERERSGLLAAVVVVVVGPVVFVGAPDRPDDVVNEERPGGADVVDGGAEDEKVGAWGADGTLGADEDLAVAPNESGAVDGPGAFVVLAVAIFPGVESWRSHQGGSLAGCSA